MRFFLIFVVLIIALLVGLYVYGGLLEPDTVTIEEDAVRVED